MSKSREIPVPHDLEGILFDYLDAARGLHYDQGVSLEDVQRPAGNADPRTTPGMWFPFELSWCFMSG